MLTKLMNSVRGRLAGALLTIALCGVAAVPALADKVTLKDGTVLEGEITREGEGFLFIKYNIGGIEQEKIVTSDQVKTIERTSDAKADKPAKKDDPKVAGATASTSSSAKSKARGTATRVAILNFGAPLNTPNRPEDMVGIQVNAEAFKHVIPMLEEDDVDVVVIRIASGGGMTLELPKFNELFEKEYKKRWRTVAWPEYAISCACMSPYVLEEIYFFRNGRMGGCTEFSGGGNASKGLNLEEILAYMEKAAVWGKKDPKIMRAMQIQEPLSCSIDPVTGEVTWFQNLDGEIVVNREKNVLTFNSEMAVKTRFAKGVADTVPELMEVMGIKEYEIVGQRASDYIDQNTRDNEKTEKELGLVWTKYQNHVEAAAGTQDPKLRGQEVGLARRYLAQIRRMLGVNPNFELMYGTDTEWFQIQEELLRDLMRR